MRDPRTSTSTCAICARRSSATGRAELIFTVRGAGYRFRDAVRKPPLLSLSVKAGLVLFLVVAGALAIVYAAVVPQLEDRLVNAKIRELRRRSR